jgi:hypothetical protein
MLRSVAGQFMLGNTYGDVTSPTGLFPHMIEVLKVDVLFSSIVLLVPISDRDKRRKLNNLGIDLLCTSLGRSPCMFIANSMSRRPTWLTKPSDATKF